MEPRIPFSKDVILLNNIGSTVDAIVEKLKLDVYHKLNRNGAVLGISGGIDSSVCLALAVKARARQTEESIPPLIPTKMAPFRFNL